MPDSKPLIRVMIVDDHPMILKYLGRAIQRCDDMEVVAQIAEGLEAIKAYEQYLPDITLLDIFMTDIDGFETIRAIVKQHPQACIIAMSVGLGGDDTLKASAAGASATLEKGLDIDQLADRIREVHGIANK